MKILYIITKSNWGGAQKYVYDLAKSETEKNDVAVIYGGDGKLAEKLSEINIKKISLANLDRDISFFDEIKTLKNLINIFYQEKPDVIHLNSSKIGGIGALAGRIAGVKKIIFTAHGFAFNEDRPFLQRTIIKLLSYTTLLLSHKTIVISKREFNQVKKWPLISKKITLIYNGISHIDFVKKDEARDFLSAKSGFENDKNTLWIGTISELTKNKGLKYAIKAIEKIKEKSNKKFVFVIIGDGSERENLQKNINETGLSETVFLAGFVQDASKYLHAFDIFLLSSVKEGLPYVLLEAGQAGNAIISTNVGGIKEIINNMEDGVLIRAKQKKEIISALDFYFNNPEKIKEFGKKIKTNIKTKFSQEKMIKQTEALY